jgi:formylmethanofuran dehydrogenase subunit E
MAYVMRTNNPYYDADRWEDQIEESYKYRPRCGWCDEKITSDYAYQVNDDLLCEDCFNDYMSEIKVDMQNYDEDGAYKDYCEREDAR